MESTFKADVRDWCQRQGWRVSDAPARAKYDLVLQHGDDTVAVFLNEQRAKLNLADVERFVSSLKRMRNATRGMLFAKSGYYKTALDFIERDEWCAQHVSLAQLAREQGLRLAGPLLEPEPGQASVNASVKGSVKASVNARAPITQLDHYGAQVEAPGLEKQAVFIGVFTCKGGVGKTTVSAHLAGACAELGQSVVLVDLDRQANLSKLLGETVQIPPLRDDDQAAPTTIRVVNAPDWRPEAFSDARLVICDCNPEFNANPRAFLERLDYAIVPTNLTPLGINKNADVIKRTFKALREVNARATLFVLINDFHNHRETKERNQRLNRLLKTELRTWRRSDPKTVYIDPFEDLAIRHSRSLLFWGYHLVEGGQPELAFRSHVGPSAPRVDFFKLVEFLSHHVELQTARRAQKKARVKRRGAAV
jgi:chromosome partitioning protein